MSGSFVSNHAIPNTFWIPIGGLTIHLMVNEIGNEKSHKNPHPKSSARILRRHGLRDRTTRNHTDLSDLGYLLPRVKAQAQASRAVLCLLHVIPPETYAAATSGAILSSSNKHPIVIPKPC